MSDFLKRIGQQAVKLAGGGSFLKLLLYSEVQDGVISADVFFQIGLESRLVHYRCAPPELSDLIYEFWENGDHKIRPRSWAAMRFWVESGRLSVHLIYPEDFDPEETLHDRRPRVVASCFPLTEVDYSKPDGDGEPPDFAAFLEGSVEGLRLQTEGHQNIWQFGRAERWDFDQNSGELVFTFPDKIVKAPAQIIGTFDGTTSTWLWAWANQSIDGVLKRDALRVLEYGKEHGIARLTTAKWKADEMDGWRMTALANRICSSNGAYRGPAGATLVFMTFGEVQLTKRA